MENKIQKRIKVIFYTFIVFTILFINCAPALADSNTNVNKKENQLMKKIKIIHEVFPQQTDEAALLATLSHQGKLTGYINDSYDENFNESNYRSQISTMKNGETNEEEITKIADEIKGESGEDKKGTKGNGVDLLTAATIIMLDSSGWTGSYSDENYQKALAGNRLIGNMVDDETAVGVIASGLNTIFCIGGAAVHTIVAPFEIGADISQGEGLNAFAIQSVHYVNMYNICNNGFVGGTYSHIQAVDDTERKQLLKEQVAEEIIKLAVELRKQKKQDNTCPTGNTQASDLSSIDAKACGEQFGSLAQAEYSRSGIFASVTLAQAWLESNCGKATPQNSNNLFGIKCSSNWSGECSSASTQEFGSGGYYTITDGFRKYPSVEDSIADHSKFLVENSRYAEAGVFTATTAEEQIKAIHAAGYATDPNYSSKVIEIIHANGFDKWDIKTNTTSSTSICSPVGVSGWAIRTIAPTESDSAFLYEGGTGTAAANRGQCVWYAKGRAIEIVEELGSKSKLSETDVNNIRNKLLQAYGDGGQIYANTRNVFNGSSNIKEPKAGSYIVWSEPGKAGHVAIVEDVNTAENTITITEGWANGGASCPTNWSCVSFQNQTFDLDEFYNGYGAKYTGGYKFEGYVYFLELK